MITITSAALTGQSADEFQPDATVAERARAKSALPLCRHLNWRSIIVRFSLMSLLFIALVTFDANCQETPTSNGACGVSPTGLMGCEWLSTPPIRWKNGETSKIPPKGVFVTRFTLSPGAPLNRMSAGEDILIVGMGNGELVNEAKAPKNHISVTNGPAMVMPKDEPYLLRNIGEESLDLVVIDVRK